MTTMTKKRTDVHRPSAPEFDPEAYDFHGVYDLGFGANDWCGPSPVKVVSALVEQGITFHGAPHPSGQCGHCGAHPRYAALMSHPETKTLLYVGETCLDNRFTLTLAEFQSLREQTRVKREYGSRVAKLDVLLEENPSLVWASYAYNIGEVGAEVVEEDGYGYNKPGTSFSDRARCGWELSTMSDIWFKVEKYLNVSPKQAQFVEDLVEKVSTKGEALEAREAAAAALVGAGVRVPEGRLVVEGEIVSVKQEEQFFGYSSTIVTKMLVVTEAGWKVYGTMPAALAEAGAEVGTKVRFTATVKPSKNDLLFGYAGRPAKAVVL